MDSSRSELDVAILRLLRALRNGRSLRYCHRLWSSVIRIRDGGVCLLCGSSENLAAHHILRKCLADEFRFEPGNGIALCRACHMEVHEKYNGAPDMGAPMDFQGGENVERMVYLLSLLVLRARKIEPLNGGLLAYYLSDSYVLASKRFQGFADDAEFSGIPLEQVYDIWRMSPVGLLKAVMTSNGALN